MINKLILQLLFSILYSTTFSFTYEDYYININKAKISSSVDSCIYYYENAFKTVKSPFPSDCIALALSYYRNNNLKKSKKAIILAVQNGFVYIKDTSNLFVLNDDPYCKNLLNPKFKFHKFLLNYLTENRYFKLRRKFLKETEDNYWFEMFLYNEKYFQETRNLWWNKTFEDSIAYNYINKYGSSANSYLFYKILKEDKLVERRKSSLSYESCFISILHTVGSFLNKEKALEMLDMLWLEVLKGQFKPDLYANAYDFYVEFYIDKNKSMFGEMTFLNSDGKLQIKELLYPDKIDSLRNAYYLLPLNLKNTLLPANYLKK